MPIGELLKAAREEKGLDLGMVEEETKIRKKYIKALEDEDFNVLPGRVYAKAFLRTYARFLGLDAEQLVAEFNAGQQAENREPAEAQLEPATVNDRRKKPFRYTNYLVAAAVVVALLIFNAFYQPTETKQGKDTGPTTPPPAVEPQTPPGPSQTTPQPPPQEGLDMMIRVVEGTSWMQVIVDGEVSYDGFLGVGRELEFKGRERIFLHVGNAGVVRVTLNGEDLGLLGEKGKVVRREFTL
ncbi:helix-turn-helix domain-containing protein [Desulforudis sp. 1088]|uniref:helix-turn-helix domain-containing protein n=1 Tax=unclassified Candidatus Desulforudis TaxID=2635950 RepID=UPI003BD2A5F0